ncbi:GNAT family N-acetyltransferase [Enterobacteriaceae bacterium ESL0689]|nr:GNAT family N-acetyltransferase [Enterobacteriaceae bacterium ESL0689]
MIPFTLRAMTTADIPAVRAFLFKHLQLFFNRSGEMPAADQDIFHLERQFIVPQRNILFGAWREDQQLIATLAVCQYDDRITELQGRFALSTTAEICRCYVDQHYRQQGIGRQLFAAAEKFCQQQGYKTLYLHTHHFLPGGYPFWLRNHFQVIMDMHDQWQLVHMAREITLSDKTADHYL